MIIMGKIRNLLRLAVSICKKNKNLLVLLLTPIIVSIIPIVFRNKSSYCAFVVLIMCVFWLTEAIPIGVTALLPIVFFPLFGILPSDEVTSGYFQDMVMLFFGSLVVGNAFEATNLHKRIALKVLITFGSDPKWLLLGFIIITGFLSLWISNAAATSIMLPVILAVVKQVIINERLHNNNRPIGETLNENKDLTCSIEIKTISDVSEMSQSNEINTVEKTNDDAKETTSNQVNEDASLFSTDRERKLVTAFLLSCGYAAIIGGVGTLVGTAPNLLAKGYFDNHYPEIHLSFLNYSLYTLPITVILLAFSWIWIVILWIPEPYKIKCCKRRSGTEDNSATNSLKIILRNQYNELGSMTWAEKCVTIIFILLIILWITRDLQGAPGWGSLFPKKFVTDTTPAIFAVLLLFICPKENIFKGKAYKNLIDWNLLQKQFTWGTILLCGGALVMADGFQSSGLSELIGSGLKGILVVKKEVTLLIIVIIGIFTSEFASNTSIQAILLPIVDVLVKETKVNPTYFLLPLTLSVSLAFMLPVGTPNMAIIYSIGRLRMRDAILTGIVMNIVSLAVIFLSANTWLTLIFDIKGSEWANFNQTTTTNSTTRVH